MKHNLCPLDQTALKFPYKSAVISGRNKISYTQLTNAVTAVQIFFQEQGVAPGANVAIIGTNCLEYITALFALWRIGAVACLLNPKIPLDETINWLNKFNCSHLICEQSFYGALPIIHFEQIKKVLTTASDSEPVPAAVAFKQPATIILTSGSTAEPKAAVHSLANHIFNALGSSENIRLKPDDRWLVSLPLFHVSGLSIVFRTVLAGATMVLTQSPNDLSDILQQQNITHVSLVTTQWFRLLQQPRGIKILKQLKIILLGGSSIPPRLLMQGRAYKLPLYTTYGLTEMASQVATTTRLCFTGKNFPQAKILPYRQVKISREGEILVKGKSLFLGYAKDGQIDKSFLKGGWFATGDLGSLNKSGVLLVQGRKDNMFISGGENIQPEEIENTLLSLAGVEQAIVVPHPDKEFGELPVAFVKASSAVSRASLNQHLARKLSRFKIPKRIFLWPNNIPATSLKVNRQQFKQLILTSQISLEQLL